MIYTGKDRFGVFRVTGIEQLDQIRSKKTRSQLEPGIGDKRKPRGPERTLEVNCSNCGAKFITYYGYDEENV